MTSQQSAVASPHPPPCRPASLPRTSRALALGHGHGHGHGHEQAYHAAPMPPAPRVPGETAATPTAGRHWHLSGTRHYEAGLGGDVHQDGVGGSFDSLAVHSSSG